jgi:hypothetical protein
VIALHERSDDPLRFRNRLGQPGKEPADIVRVIQRTAGAGR